MTTMTSTSRRGFLVAAGSVAAGLTLAGAEERKASPTHIRLGIVTYNIASDWDLPTLLGICQRVGLNPVELRTTHAHGVEPTLSAQERRDVKQRFKDAGVEIWGCGSVCEFHAADDAVVAQQIETCKRFTQLVADIGGKGVKVRPNGLPQGVPIEKTLEQIGKALTECGKAAADAGGEIWLEVHGAGTSHPPHCKTIMEHSNHPAVGLTWNSNATDLVNGSVAESFRLLRPWIKSCHINELTSGYPYRELFRLLRESNYDRVMLAEIQGMPKLDGKVNVALGERFMQYYKALWTELMKG